jgi:hypothetical protein
MVLSFYLELDCKCIEMEGDLGSTVRFRQRLIILFYNCHICNVNWMRIPGIVIIDHKFLSHILHQRMRNVLLLDGTFDISELRVEELRAHVSRFERMCLFC